MKFKVRDGTVQASGSSLCATCRHSIVIRGQTLGEEIVQCRATLPGSTRVTFKVSSCSAYMDVRHPTYMEMVQDAWILQPGSKKRRAGFVRTTELGEDELANVMIGMPHYEGE